MYKMISLESLIRFYIKKWRLMLDTTNLKLIILKYLKKGRNFHFCGLFIILIQIMIRKVLLNKSLAHLLLFKPNRLISLHYIKRASQKLQFNNSSIYGYKSFYLFSNEGNIGSEKSAIDEANQLYSTHGWSDEFIQQSLKSMAKYEQIQDWESLLTIIQFHLQKTKQNSGILNNQYVSRLAEGIYYSYVVEKIEKAEQWLNILYDILSNNPQLGKDPFNNMHYQYEVAQMLGKANNRQQGQKWLELFKNKFKDFDQTEQITEDQRFFTYLQLTEYSGYANRIQQGLEYSKKTFDMIQSGRVENLQKELQIAAIFNYGIAQYKFADKETGIKAFKLIEQSFNQNNPSTLLLVLNICSSYSLVDGLIERGSALLQKYQKLYAQKKDVEEYKGVYDNSVFYRVRIYFSYQKYEKLYESLNIAFEKYQKNMPNQTLFFYHLLAVLSQHKLGKKQEAQKSMQKTLVILKQNQVILPKNTCKELLNDIDLVVKKMQAELSPAEKQILTKIKQLIKSKEI